MLEPVPLFEARVLPDEPVFDSFNQAIGSIMNKPRTNAGQYVTKQVIGKEIVNVTYADSSFQIMVDDGQYLVFCLDGGVVQFFRQPTIYHVDDTIDKLGAKVRLRFSKDREPLLWDRDKLVADLMGKRIVLIAASHSWAFLTVRVTLH